MGLRKHNATFAFIRTMLMNYDLSTAYEEDWSDIDQGHVFLNKS